MTGPVEGMCGAAGRTGFVGWEGNQSLRALLTRLAGSVAGAGPVWLAVALVTAAAGLACAALLDRAGHPLPGLLACALTGLLVSPVSWDHHWVWIAPGVAVAAAYAVRAMHSPDGPARLSWRRAVRWPAGVLARAGSAGPGASATGPPPGGTAVAGTSSGLHWRRARRWPAAGYWALAAALLALYGAWPGRLWGKPHDLGQFSLGLLWQPPNTDPEIYYRLGDRPWFAEYHWHGIQLLTGNAFLLGGLALLGILIAAALRTRATPSPTIPRDPTGPSSPASRAPSARTQS